MLKVANDSGDPDLELDYDTVERLAGLPLHCVTQQYPNKLQQVLQGEEELLPPSTLHPIFYGQTEKHFYLKA